MKVRTNRSTSITHIAKNLITMYKLPRSHGRHLHVPITGLEAVAMVQDYKIPKRGTQLGNFNNAIRRSINRSPTVIGNVNPLVHLAHFARHRMDTRSKSRCIATSRRRNRGDVTQNGTALINVLGQSAKRLFIVLDFAKNTPNVFVHLGGALKNRRTLAQ